MSALRTGLTLSPGKFQTLISVGGLGNPRVIVRPQGLGQRTNDLMAYSGVRHLTTLPRSPRLSDVPMNC